MGFSAVFFRVLYERRAAESAEVRSSRLVCFGRGFFFVLLESFDVFTFEDDRKVSFVENYAFANVFII